MVHFRGTDAETRICPRRHAINNPFVFTAQDVYNGTEGSLGVKYLEVTNRLADSISIIKEALAWRREASDGI